MELDRQVFLSDLPSSSADRTVLAPVAAEAIVLALVSLEVTVLVALASLVVLTQLVLDLDSLAMPCVWCWKW